MTVPGYLETEVEGVPGISQPLYWDANAPVTMNEDGIERWMAEYTRLLPKGCSFDEAAILVPTLWHSMNLDRVLHANRWERFNEASDLVYTNPFGTRYFVNYRFYRHERKNYRLEVMRMDQGRIDDQMGFSPLHSALWVPDGVAPNTAGCGRYPVPHLSFKPVRNSTTPTLEQRREGRANEAKQTWGQAYGQAVQHLKEQGCIHAQSCQSTYGRFGYFLHQDATKQLYIKPRINTRDDVMHSMCTVDSHDGCLA